MTVTLYIPASASGFVLVAFVLLGIRFLVSLVPL